MKKLLIFGIASLLFFVVRGNMLKENMVNVKTFGAIGDGLMLDTLPIQNALNTGKIVYFPAGVYRTGTLYLRSGGGIHLDANALILGSKNQEDYNANDFDPRNTFSIKERASGAHLIIARDCENISITGSGAISGNRSGIFDTDIIHTPNNARPRYVLPRWRPGAMLYFVGCKKVKISGISLNEPTYWTCLLHDCEDVTVDRLTIRTDRFTNNSDGLDIDCCRRVNVTNCNFFCGDDALTIRGNRKPLKNNAVSSDITVSNCILSSAACGVRIGVGNGKIRNCKLSNLQIVNTLTGIGICPSYSMGNCVEIENVIFENCRIDSIQNLVLTPNWGQDIDDPEVKPVRNLIFRNIDAAAERASLIVAPFKKDIFENIRIENSSFTLRSGGTSPKRSHWTKAEFGVFNLIGFDEKIFVNCKLTSEDGKPSVVTHKR